MQSQGPKAKPVSKPFVHLHLHTQYSLLDGAIRIDPLIEKLKEYQMDAVAITDHGTMFGAVEFYDKMTKAGIRPVIGCECYLAPRKLTDKNAEDGKNLSHLVLLAKNREGYLNLCRLASIAQVEGFYYKPRIDKEVLQEHAKGLVALSACLKGEIPQHLINGRDKEAAAAARFYLELFGEENFFLEVQNNGMEIQNQVNQKILDLSKELSIPMVATNDCHYLNKEDVKAHDVLLCIQTGKTVKDENRFRFQTDELYFKSPEEMAAQLGEFPGAIENTEKIARCCQVDFDFKTFHFPNFDKGEAESVDVLFEQKVREGFSARMARIREKNPDVDTALYEKRLDYEIGVIRKMQFSAYFLIVSDFIRYAKENGVPVGPGRGSAAGSMVAYSLGITGLDPIAHGLIFERFLNPARISMPDIDVDFCINGREKVFKYVVNTYGGESGWKTGVSQIITFGKMKTRLVIRDVGRALDIPLKEVDSLAKMVPDVLNISLEDAISQEPRIREMMEERQDIKELIEISRVLEGLPRHASTHAAGVVIGDKPLVEYLPLYKGKNDEIATQYDMKRVEQIGLVKFDFLGLRNLTVIEDTLRLIRSRGETPPDLENLDLGDEKTYALLSKGDTTGVFQLESSGMKELLIRMKPACFEDLIALVALYRPGPLESGMVDDFVERKHGRKEVEYLVPELEPILQDTYGVIVYQEQVMKIAGVLANYSMAEADMLRKAMGKKVASIMAEHRGRFVEGAVGNTIPKPKATEIFDLMEKFGGYGFNKSHSAAYALIAFQTAYLKAHFPVAFMAALLTSEMNSSDNVVKFINACRTRQIPVLPPDINKSGKEFTVTGNDIRFGLLAVKNVGESAIDSILEAREKGDFENIFDFIERVDQRKINKRVLESLIKCGAFDSLGENRSRLMAGIEAILAHGQRVHKEKDDRQMTLFDMMEDDNNNFVNTPSLPEAPFWDDRTRLFFEKESLGFYVSGHPLSSYETILSRFTNHNTLTLKEGTNKARVIIGGVISLMKQIKTKKGEDMAFITIEDMTGSCEITIFSNVFAQAYDHLYEENPILVEGEVEKDENSVKILANRIIPIDQAEEILTTAIRLNLDATRTKRETLIRLKDIFTRHPGGCKTFLRITEPGKSRSVVAVSDSLRIKPEQSLFKEVNDLFGENVIECICNFDALPKTERKNRYPKRKQQ